LRSCPGLLLLVGVVAACGFHAQGDADPIPTEELPSGLRPDATSVLTTPVESERAIVWFVHGETLVPVRHEVEAPLSVDSITIDLLTGPNVDEADRGLRSALPDPAVVVGASASRGLATVELTESFTELSPEDQLLAVGQFVLTLTEVPGVGSVRFELAGERVAVPLPTGESTDSPAFREQFIELSHASNES
jgi:spore germination protein GerM